MKKNSLIVFFLCFTCYTYTQILIRGIVRNKETKEIIPYANIVSLKNGFATSSSITGSFEVKGMNFIPDSVLVSSIGYYPVSIFQNFYSQNDTILLIVELEEKVYGLNEFVVNNRVKKKIHKLGFNDSRHSNFCTAVSPGNQFALYIENSLRKKAVVEKVKVRFTKFTGFKIEKFVDVRIRIYSVNKNTGAPDEDMLKEKILIRPRYGNYTVDIGMHNIIFPENGLFIGIEWEAPQDISYGNKTSVGPFLKWASSATGKSQTWVNRNKGWKLETFKAFNIKEIRNAMIGIEVSTDRKN